MREIIEPKWIDCFEESFLLSGVDQNQTIVLLYESQSRQVLVDLSEQALLRIGAKPGKNLKKNIIKIFVHGRNQILRQSKVTK